MYYFLRRLSYPHWRDWILESLTPLTIRTEWSLTKLE